MRIQFKVTEDHILYGLPTSLSKCPVALAIRDQFPDADIEVGRTFILIERRFYPVPEQVAEFVQDFDTEETGRPFQFTLDIDEHRPAESSR